MVNHAQNLKVANESEMSANHEFAKIDFQFKRFIYQIIGSVISQFSRYYDRVIYFHPRAEDSGGLFNSVECKDKLVVSPSSPLPDLSNEKYQRTLLVVNGNFNHDTDIQGTLLDLKEKISRTTRIAVVLYNPYLRSIYFWANKFGLRKGDQPTTFVTRGDLDNLCKIAGYELVKLRPLVHIPFRAFGLGTFLNRILPTIPFVKWFSLTCLAVLRPIIPQKVAPSVTILIPARNEKGNIEAALQRIPDLGTKDIEVIYVEGHSSDGTWEEIQRVIPLYSDRYQLSAYQQTGKGKADAVRLGFSKANKDLLMILDADLTMPPEMLPRYVNAYSLGQGDFINGHRLLYPMESQAMRFLNWLGNLFFAKTLSSILECSLGDSLCGTKVVTRHDYERMTRWREDFDDFDPFGDFELLFPAAILNLGVVNIPIRYRDRVYGSTQIRRFYHGLMLLKMTAIGFWRVKVGPTVSNN